MIVTAMELPNGKRAVVDVAKLRDYCLNPAHPYGRHKATVFRAALGLERSDAEKLRLFLLNAASNGDATMGEKDDHGQ